MKMIFSLVVAMSAASAQAGDLTLELHGIQAGKGQLMIGVFDSAESFLKKSMRKLVVPATSADMTVSLPNLPEGVYAVSLYQDLNSNRKFDTHLFGIPAEPYGVSNNAEGFMGPPKFDAAKITVPAQGLTTSIKLHD
ncbi:DUF2141 domain-containing protein [Duganella sp. FT94W]|uniref:DUF2141 domain-containing protein n=1 Tax=Duganella lactea TaxID=2692173 RepID=A0ABW9VCR4_9BURK|nr:DUF2141 domain-containing protein [Duganella lactea]MYM36413.1 DUF2141 domain-containing protein [Duganella lactea]